MRLLLDTHIAVWVATSPDELTRAERRCIERARGQPVLSAVSIWELRLKWNRIGVSGERKGPVEPSVIVAFAKTMRWQLLQVTMQHAGASLRQPLGHADPFDDMLLVQAQEEGLRLLTRDAKLLDHTLATSG